MMLLLLMMLLQETPIPRVGLTHHSNGRGHSGSRQRLVACALADVGARWALRLFHHRSRSAARLYLSGATRGIHRCQRRARWGCSRTSCAVLARASITPVYAGGRGQCRSFTREQATLSVQKSATTLGQIGIVLEPTAEKQCPIT